MEEINVINYFEIDFFLIKFGFFILEQNNLIKSCLIN